MSKRNKVVKISSESEALKHLREKNGLSLRKLADKMAISFARAHQMESGREDISKEYIDKFLAALNLTWEDWCYNLGQKELDLSMDNHFREECIELIWMLEPSKLENAYFDIMSL